MEEIKKTTDYNQFKRAIGNRDIDESLVQKIQQSVQLKDLLMYNPIIVNENMEIIDGQHTLEAARRSNKPIYYMISVGANINDIARLNVNKKSWLTTDYVKSYVERGYDDYKILFSFMRKYGISAGTAGLLLTGDESSTPDKNRVTIYSLYNKIKSGHFIVTDLDHAEEMANLLIKLSDYCKTGFWRTREFVGALSEIHSQGLHTDLLHKLETWIKSDAQRLERAARKVDYLRQFEDILNRGSSRGYRLY